MRLLANNLYMEDAETIKDLVKNDVLAVWLRHAKLAWEVWVISNRPQFRECILKLREFHQPRPFEGDMPEVEDRYMKRSYR
jgi:hypothetical protein